MVERKMLFFKEECTLLTFKKSELEKENNKLKQDLAQI